MKSGNWRAAGLILLAGLFTTVYTVASAERYEGCLRKERAVERELEEARRHGPKDRIRGLERALGHIRDNCSEAGLRADADRDVREHEREVAERRQDLEKARAKGKPDKIAKREKKLREAEAELREAQARRSSLP